MENSTSMPRINGSEVIGVSRTEDSISSLHLKDGRELSLEAAHTFVSNGDSEGLIAGSARDGSITIHGTADGDPSNNLSNLPEM